MLATWMKHGLVKELCEDDEDETFVRMEEMTYLASMRGAGVTFPITSHKQFCKVPTYLHTYLPTYLPTYLRYLATQRSWE